MQIRKIFETWSARIKRELRVSTASPFKNAGKTAAAERRWEEAIAAYQRHLERRPHDGQSWLRLANALKDAGLFANADATYAKACRIMPTSADVWLNRGHLAKLEGRTDDALKYYMRSFDLDGGAAAGREILAAGRGALPRKMARKIVGSVDGMVGRTIFGWAVDPKDPKTPAKIEFLQQNERIGEVVADLARADVLSAGFGTLNAGFRFRLGPKYRPERGEITVRLSSNSKPLVNSPYAPKEKDVVGSWLDRWTRSTPAAIGSLKDRYDQETDGHCLSILMPVFNPPLPWLIEAIESVLVQLCSRWELICIDDCSTDPKVTSLIESYVSKDSRIRLIRLEVNGGISKATNAGLAAANGSYVGFMDHDDILEPEAVYRMLYESKNEPDLIYSDEILVGSDSNDVIDVIARPAFSYDYYISHPYFVHFIVVRRSLAQSIGGLDENMSISMDVDFILKVIERADTVVHVPVPLYRWRTHEGSEGHVQKGRVMEATRISLENHHARLSRSASVSFGKTFNTFRTDYEDNGGKVLAIIPTKDRLDLIKPCIDSILRTTDNSVDLIVVDHETTDIDVLKYFSSLPDRVRFMKFCGDFNYSKMNNMAVNLHGNDYEFVLFLNNDVEAIENGWLEHMRGICQREDVGAVGALLLYGDDRVQHGGVVLGVGGPAEHAYKGEPYRLGSHVNPGYGSGLVSVRDYMAVTGACMMVRAAAFRSIDGFDENLAVGFNDVDLCLRLRSNGYKVLFDGHAVLHHYESATRSVSKQLLHPTDTELLISRWAKLLSCCDPYFSPMFGSAAPVSYSVVAPIDVYSPARVWKRGMRAQKINTVSRLS